jgi:hypothetical protein
MVRISQAEKFFILAHLDKMSYQEMANLIGCSVATIKNHAKRERPQKKDIPTTDDKVTPTTTAPSPDLPVPSMDLIGRHPRGAVVMTKAASEVGDITSKMSGPEKSNRGHVRSIINPEK